jgi:hypothetical protein
MSKGRTTGDNMDGNERDPKKQVGPDSKPMNLTDEQKDKILEATLNGVSAKDIKALISKLMRESDSR